MNDSQEKQQQGQQKPPTTYTRAPLDRLLWDCVANGVLMRSDRRHLTEQQLQWVVGRVQRYDGQSATAAAMQLRDDLEGRQIIMGGELLGTILSPDRRLYRCQQIVTAVRRAL